MSPEPAEIVIGVEALCVRYGRTVALSDVTLEVAAGDVYALVGRNGAGKSSLVRCVLGHEKPRRGRTALFGRDSWKHRARLMERIGVVPEEPDAPPAMTARQLSRFCSRLYARWNGDGFSRRLKRFEVPLDAAFGRLSKGQKGQVMLALALAPSPQLLILDDPTLGLDVVAKKAVFEELVVELADRGITVFLTSHDLSGIEAIANRIAMLSGGRLLVDEDLEALKARFRRVTVDRLRAGGEGSDLLSELEPRIIKARGRGLEALVSRFDEERFALLKTAPRLGGAEAHPVSLEEILIALSGEAAGAAR